MRYLIQIVYRFNTSIGMCESFQFIEVSEFQWKDPSFLNRILPSRKVVAKFKVTDKNG